jgi:hypothetical protein
MCVQVDDHGPLDVPILHQGPNAEAHVGIDAKAAALFARGVVETAADVDGPAMAQGEAGGENRATGLVSSKHFYSFLLLKSTLNLIGRRTRLFTRQVGKRTTTQTSKISATLIRERRERKYFAECANSRSALRALCGLTTAPAVNWPLSGM